VPEKHDRKIIVDASIAVKWFNPSEDFGEIAARLFRSYKQGEFSFTVPEFFYYEVANGINKAIARKDITKEEGMEAIDTILGLEMEVYSLPDVKSVYSFSQRCKRSIYDCFYLMLAQSLGIEFWTADEKLYNAVKDSIKSVKWIGDY